ncbi:heparan-alpha-glucosaminide N-acetyltransferase domain-containing protein [Nocardioides sp.]|uniref:heparan-alpha-glucosaminide N-acetyltransferase domain-containing protein n=1 Tax=Nocardioides sp. TaxID=35761 RepID=UPI002ED4433E
MAQTLARTVAAPRQRGERLVGLDVARCLALLGMVSTHVLAPVDEQGEITWTQDLAGGRASALFALLAGVSLALLSGRRTPPTGRARWVAVRALAVRALLIAAIGLTLGMLDSGLAVILTYYGVMFLLALPFIGLRARSLALLAAAWVVVVPVLSHLVRPSLPAPRGDNAAWGQLSDPVPMLWELLLTGYYPALPWLAYLFAGMALGRSDLARRSVQVGLLVGGVALAVGTTWLSDRLTADRFTSQELSEAGFGMYGTTPAGGSADYLLLVAPHSATPFDLAQTIGSSLAVIGGCLVLLSLLPPTGARFMAVLFGAGTMTLSLYSLHVWMRTDGVWPPEEEWSMFWYVLILGVIGAVFAVARVRGPLEAVVARIAR